MNEAIRRHVSALELLFLEAGDHETRGELQKILDSTNQAVSLHSALTRRLRKRTTGDNSLSERYQFFSNFRSPSGNRLNHSQINDLFNITSKWELDDADIQALKLCSQLWANNPVLFWEGEKQKDDLIRRLFDDLQRMDGVDPSKRKVLLVKFSQEIEHEQRQIEEHSERRKRESLCRMDKEECHRKGVHLTTSLHRVFYRHYPRLENITKNTQRDRFAKYSRYGWKWDQLGYPEMLLSLSGVPVKRFERRGWKPIEFMAVRKFLETLPQFRIRAELARAWKSITTYYKSGSIRTDTHLDNQTSNFPGNNVRSEIPITIVPSRLGSQRKRKRALVSLEESNKKRQYVFTDEISSSSDQGASCGDNFCVISEANQAPDEQVGHLSMPADASNLNVNKDNAPKEIEPASYVSSKILSSPNHEYTRHSTSQFSALRGPDQDDSAQYDQLDEREITLNEQPTSFPIEEMSIPSSGSCTGTHSVQTIQDNLMNPNTDQGKAYRNLSNLGTAYYDLREIGNSSQDFALNGTSSGNGGCGVDLHNVELNTLNIPENQQVDQFDIFNLDSTALFHLFDYPF